ncbi:hypothetical protein FHW67_002011 [Herbaspirillum sp. Sphag1AN]|nr:hypothetical protein [Herbaspirillum sp. Sphag1AN]MBB3245925.1 hypothetical protein [Herbaspirillum sp. Sphag64]
MEINISAELKKNKESAQHQKTNALSRTISNVNAFREFATHSARKDL